MDIAALLSDLREDLGERDSQDRWIKAWKVMASKDERIKLEEWVYALKKITGNTGMAYGKNTEVEGAFIRRVVEEVCRLLPPDVKWDVSNVRSINKLSEVCCFCAKSFSFSV